MMVASVQKTGANQDPGVTNFDTFMSDFLQRLGVPQEVAQPIFDTFSCEDFPRLQAHTTFRPAAQPVVKALLAAGHTVVVATNPLFPETAGRQRMEWAGVNNFSYALVTTMENSHFIKPNLNYYQEILDYVGATPETTWMVGNDLEQDITPTHNMGIKAWWITDHLEVAPAEPPLMCTGHGNLAQFGQWRRKI